MVLLATYFAMYSFIKCGIYRTIKQYSIMTFHALYTPIFWQGLRSTFRSISIINVNKNGGDTTQSEQHLSAFCSYIASCIVLYLCSTTQIQGFFSGISTMCKVCKALRHLASEQKKNYAENIEQIILKSQEVPSSRIHLEQVLFNSTTKWFFSDQILIIQAV